MSVKISRKHFNDQAKRLKRRNILTAGAARDYAARKHGFPDFAVMEQAQVAAKEWKA